MQLNDNFRFDLYLEGDFENYNYRSIQNVRPLVNGQDRDQTHNCHHG